MSNKPKRILRSLITLAAFALSLALPRLSLVASQDCPTFTEPVITCGQISCSSCVIGIDCDGNACLVCVTVIPNEGGDGFQLFIDTLGDC